jgi:addiction module HigA family antidote
MSRKHNPPHPGETLKDGIFTGTDLSVTAAAKQLGVTRAALSRLLNGKAALSPEMALRLEEWLGVENGGRADLWIAQQAAYDLWQARQKPRPKIVKLELHA